MRSAAVGHALSRCILRGLQGGGRKKVVIQEMARARAWETQQPGWVGGWVQEPPKSQHQTPGKSRRSRICVGRFGKG